MVGEVFYGLVKLIISGGGGSPPPEKVRDERILLEKQAADIVTRWEFIEELEQEQEKAVVVAMEVEKKAKEEKFNDESKPINLDNLEQENDSKKKNKKKKHKRKKRSNSVNSMEEVKNGVCWGHVEEITFSRELGYHTVPNSGNFPLGLGEEVSRSISTIQQHLAATQIRLLERAIDIGLDVSAIKSEPEVPEAPPSETDDDTTPKISLETRQYDYRKGYNPLFRPLTEADRIVVLGALTRQSTHDGIPIASLNKELVDIRKSREDVGCNCKQIKLDKLNVNKLRQALIAYQETIQPSSSLPSSGQDSSSTAENQQQGQFYEILSSKQIDSLSKSELINRLRGIYKSCPLCVINDCACVISGVGCHSNVCCCFRAGGVKHNCENPEGYRIYNADAVKEYRKGYLTAVSIVPNASSTSSATKSVNASVRSRAYST